MADDLNPVSPIISGGSVTSANPIPVWVVSGGTSGSIGFPIASGQVGSVLSGGTILVASGALISVTGGGSIGIAGSQTIQSGGALGVASGGSVTISNGATLGTNSGSTLGINAGTLIPASAANTLNAALTNDPTVMPYQTNNWYFGPAGISDSGGGVLVNSGTMMAVPFFVAQPGANFTSMGIFAISNALTYSVNFGVYRANSTGSTTVPTGASLVAGTGSSGVSIVSNTSGLQTIDISGVSFSVGWYFLAYLPGGTMSGYRLLAGDTAGLIGQRKGQSTFGSAVLLSGSYFHSQTFGSLPSTFPISSLGQSSPATTIALGMKAA